MSDSLELQGIVVVIVVAPSAVHFQTILQLSLSLSLRVFPLPTVSGYSKAEKQS